MIVPPHWTIGVFLRTDDSLKELAWLTSPCVGGMAGSTPIDRRRAPARISFTPVAEWSDGLDLDTLRASQGAEVTRRMGMGRVGA